MEKLVFEWRAGDRNGDWGEGGSLEKDPVTFFNHIQNTPSFKFPLHHSIAMGLLNSNEN